MESTNSLDILFSFDDTGSMSSVRRQVRQNIKGLVDNLMSGIPGIRIGVIIHNDYCDFPDEIYVMDFTTDKDVIKDFIGKDSPCGGGDAAECYELALSEAGKLSWKSDKRAMILIGDEVPHEVGYRYGRFTNKLNWREEALKLAANGVQVYGVQALGRKACSFFYEQISKMTGGTKLDLNQFQHIPMYLNAVAYQQSGQLDEYQGSNPVFSTNTSLKNMFNRLRGGSGVDLVSSVGGRIVDTEILSRFQVMEVVSPMKIKDFVELMGCTFKRGNGYYQLIARTADGKANFEEVQANKEVIFVDKLTGEAIADTEWCREQLGVPYGIKGKVRPLQIPEVMDKYDVFIQSNSYTRNLDCSTKFLYELEHV